MKKSLIFLHVAAIACAAGMTSCVDNEEGAGLEKLREGIGNYYNGKAAVENANAAYRQAEADLKVAIREYEVLQAKYKAEKDASDLEVTKAKNAVTIEGQGVSLDSIKAVRESVVAKAKAEAEAAYIKAWNALELVTLQYKNAYTNAKALIEKQFNEAEISKAEKAILDTILIFDAKYGKKGLNVYEAKAALDAAETALLTKQTAWTTANKATLKAQKALNEVEFAKSDSMAVLNAIMSTKSKADAAVAAVEDEKKGLKAQLTALIALVNEKLAADTTYKSETAAKKMEEYKTLIHDFEVELKDLEAQKAQMKYDSAEVIAKIKVDNEKLAAEAKDLSKKATAIASPYIQAVNKLYDERQTWGATRFDQSWTYEANLETKFEKTIVKVVAAGTEKKEKLDNLSDKFKSDDNFEFENKTIKLKAAKLENSANYAGAVEIKLNEAYDVNVNKDALNSSWDEKVKFAATAFREASFVAPYQVASIENEDELGLKLNQKFNEKGEKAEIIKAPSTSVFATLYNALGTQAKAYYDKAKSYDGLATQSANDAKTALTAWRAEGHADTEFPKKADVKNENESDNAWVYLQNNTNRSTYEELRSEAKTRGDQVATLMDEVAKLFTERLTKAKDYESQLKTRERAYAVADQNKVADYNRQASAKQAQIKANDERLAKLECKKGSEWEDGSYYETLNWKINKKTVETKKEMLEAIAKAYETLAKQQGSEANTVVAAVEALAELDTKISDVLGKKYDATTMTLAGSKWDVNADKDNIKKSDLLTTKIEVINKALDEALPSLKVDQAKADETLAKFNAKKYKDLKPSDVAFADTYATNLAKAQEALEKAQDSEATALREKTEAQEKVTFYQDVYTSLLKLIEEKGLSVAK